MEFKVSVRLMCYNQEKYIAQAVDSILAQRTNFPVELVIGDDLSSDNTFNLICRYSSTQNVSVKILDRRNDTFYKQQRKKYGRNYNNTDILKNCSGEYVAMLEGDDYWIDNNKLQKQVDFLDTNPDFSFCYHHVKIIQEDNFTNQVLEMPFKQPEFSDITAILNKSIWPHTNSVVFRNQPLIKNFPLWFYKCFSADWALLSLIAGDKKIKYISQTMSVYRQHSGGIWSKNTKIKNALNTIETAKIINAHIASKGQRKYTYWPIHYAYLSLIAYFKPHNPIKYLYYTLTSKLLSFKYRWLLKAEIIRQLGFRGTMKKLKKKTG